MDPSPPTRPSSPGRRPARRAGPVRYAVGVLLLAAAYYAAARVGLALPYVGQNITLVWPPTGIAVAFLFRYGLRYWPGVLLAAFAVNAEIAPAWAAVGVAAGNALAPVAAVAVLRRVRFDPAFNSQRDPVWFVGVALGAMTISAANGTAWRCLDGQGAWDRFGEGWLAWWVGDAVGVLVFGAPLLTFSRKAWRTIHRRGEAGPLALAFVACFLIGVVCLGPVSGELSREYPLVLCPAVFLLWVAVRYGVWAGSVCGVILAGVALWATAAGAGPFARADGTAGLVMLWGYVGGLTGAALLIAAVAAGRDRAEAKLAASEALYRSLVEDNTAMICRLGPDGTITFANETYCRAYRTTADRAVGRPFSTGHPPEDQARLVQALDGLRAGGPPATVEVLAPGGRLRWHKWTVRAVGGQAGPPAGFQAVGLDVTELRRAEHERRVIEEEMFQAQKLEGLGVLAGGIAHDFNNILTGIMGHAELAAEEPSAGPEVRHHLHQIVEAARRVADRIRQLRAYAGKGPMAVRPLDLNAVVRDTADLVAVSLPRRCQVRFDPAPDLPLVEADDGQVRQVITNLLINAGEAMGDRAGIIRVRTELLTVSPDDESSSGSRTVLTAGDYVALRVSDTGCGMDEATRARVFDPFFSTKFAGRGLGLAAVHGIVRAHRGAVEVETAPGSGTEFTVLLPALPTAPPAERPSSRPPQVSLR